MLGARDSIQGVVEGVELGASHGIGHQLGAMGVAHGVTSCVLLPTVCEWNAQEEGCMDKQKGVEKIVRDAASLGSSKEDDGGKGLGAVLRVVFGKLGMPEGLVEVGVGKERWEELARRGVEDGCTRTNPRRVEGIEDVMEILRLVENGR